MATKRPSYGTSLDEFFAPDDGGAAQMKQNAMQAASAAAAAAENQINVMRAAGNLRTIERNAMTRQSERGNVGLGRIGGGTATSTSGPGAADPRAALQAAELAFKSSSQDKSIAAGDRDRADRLAAADRDRAERLAAQKDLTKTSIEGRITEGKAATENQDELRRKAALRALETFNSSKPGSQPGLSNQGKIA